MEALAGTEDVNDRQVVVKVISELPIEEQEAKIDALLLGAIQHLIEAVKALYQMERLKSFRKNPRFKGATFEQYLKQRFPQISPLTYRHLRRAVFGYEEQIEKWGPNTVLRVLRYCNNPDNVFKELEAAQKKRELPIPIDKQLKIISRHERPKTPSAGSPDKEDLQQIIWEKEAVIRELQERLREKMEQVEKLKATIQKIRGGAGSK